MFERRSDLKKFLAVVESGTVLGAADRIAMTQPALSRAIARLETAFGGKLFERLPTGVRLTEFGVTVAEQARHILCEMEIAERRVKSALAGHSSGLRVTAGPTWMQAIMPEVAARFHGAFPDVELKLHAMTFLEGIRLLVNGESDFHCGRIDSERYLPAILRRECFLNMTSSIVACSDHPLHTADAISWDDLVAWPWIDCEAPARLQDDEEHSSLAAFLDELFVRTQRRVRTVVRAGPAGLILMSTGPYLSRLPITFLERLPDLRLKPLPVAFGSAQFRAGIVSRAAAWDCAAFRHFAAIVREVACERRRQLQASHAGRQRPG